MNGGGGERAFLRRTHELLRPRVSGYIQVPQGNLHRENSHLAEKKMKHILEMLLSHGMYKGACAKSSSEHGSATLNGRPVSKAFI